MSNKARAVALSLALALVASSCSQQDVAGPAEAVESSATTPTDVTPESRPVPADDSPAEAVESSATTPTDVTPESRPVPADDSPAEPAHARASLFFDDLRDRGFSGVVLLESGGHVVTEPFGFADRATGTAIDAETVFDIGSLTKQFTAAAILRLEMDGRLSVDDTLGQYLPDLTPQQGAITLHQLLTHTAGLPDALGFDYQPIDRAGFVALVAESPLISPPGERYEYSNVGYSLLAAIVEVVTGDSYERYLSDALFVPAGMQSTGYVLPDWGTDQVAIGYDGDRAVGRPNEQRWDSDGPYWHLRGNGGLLSTAGDMFRWHQALVDDTVLDAAAKAKMYTRHTAEGPDADTYYGYGWAIFPTPFDTRLVTHNGGNGIFFADFLRFLDEEVTIFIATNATSGNVEDAAFELASMIFDEPSVAPAVCDIAVASPADIREVDRFPDTTSGAVAQRWFDIMLSKGDGPLEAFVIDHVATELTGGAPVADVIGEIGELQDEVRDMTVVRLLQESDGIFHVVMRSPSGDELTASVGFSEADPERIHCVSISV